VLWGDSRATAFPDARFRANQRKSTGAKMFEVACRGIDGMDNARLIGFFSQMSGRLGTFRFDHLGTTYPKCRFDSDSLAWAKASPTTYNLTMRISILAD
jgi:hypothetical protein